MSSPVIILGAGYTGRFLAAALTQSGRPYFATSRSPQEHLAFVSTGQRLPFDLTQTATWIHIPPRIDLLWCFPAAPLELVRQFAAFADCAARRTVVLGSTSAYGIGDTMEYPPPWLDETAPIDLSKPRVAGEEFLRHECGAIVLRVAGIYGPGRNPVNWIRDGRVGPSRKHVNLIHVEDLAAICLQALERGTRGEVYNVSDGVPRTWEDICREAQDRYGITAARASSDGGTGKRISTVKLKAFLSQGLRHPDLFSALAGLTKESS